MQKFIILHTNDIHGRVEGLARIATLIEQIRAENADLPVLYFDAGDSEETSTRLSNLTKGVAMHRLLSVAGCAVATVGNGGILRYSQSILKDYAQVAHYPQLLANLRDSDGSILEGVQATTLLDAGSCKLGIIGVTATKFGESPLYEDFFYLRTLPPVPLISELAEELRQQGADVIILLSHLGMPEDIITSIELKTPIPLIIGAHTHNLAPAGVWNGSKILIAQAGCFAEHLGRLDLTWDGTQLLVDRVSVIPVTDDIAPLPRMLEEIATIEAEVEQSLNTIIGTLVNPLDLATDRECGVANLMADALREYTEAEVAVIEAGVAFNGPLPAGPLKRVTLWDACSSSANPATAFMTGKQLEALIMRGQNPDFAAHRPRSHRGGARGFLHLSGASLRQGQLYIGEQPVEPERVYKVGASDWELGSYGHYAESSWKLAPTYEFETILRDAVEAYLKDKPPVTVAMGRLA
ncbi:MAG TPA: bifunctional UDP-sugar hydrolase/5'-nucleotidase [Ktedonobacteraceae bacterium]|nr:bifunctional UDP-sugar hydrolase/5'-nucleotidase [Ktedonobacteraceae bacterium]